MQCLKEDGIIASWPHHPQMRGELVGHSWAPQGLLGIQVPSILWLHHP